MEKIIDFERDMPHETAELICLECKHRWMGVWPVGVPLKKLECPEGHVGLAIKTGQTLE